VQPIAQKWLYVILFAWDGMDWIKLAQDRDWWRALMTKVINLRVLQNCWEFPEWLHNWRLLRKGKKVANKTQWPSK
jgi:hypothetical protein